MKGITQFLLLNIAIVSLLSAPLVLAQETGPNILFIFDSSGSMTEPLGDKTKLDTAKEVLSALVGDLPPGTNMGLEVYGHRKGGCDDIEMIFPMGKPDLELLRQKIASLSAGGKTPIAASLQQAANELTGIKGKRTVVLISDGLETCNGDPVGTAEFIKNEFGIDVVIHAVGFAVDDAAKQQLTLIAEAGGGSYYAANNAQQLKQSLVEIKEKAAEPPQELLVEEFNGPLLADAWEIINVNPDNGIVDEGKFLVVTAPGDVHLETAENMILYKENIPAENYDVIAEFSTSILDEYFYNTSYDNTQNGQVSGVVLYLDKDNYLELVVGGSYGWAGYGAGRAVMFFKRQSGKRENPFSKNIGALKNPDTYRLKIEKRKHNYTAYYFNPEEGEWQEIGKYTVLGKKFRPGLVTYRSKSAKEVTTEFDTLKVMELKE